MLTHNTNTNTINTHYEHSHIGNALGYVRMVRSASMYYCSEAVKYLPDFDDIISFEDCAGEGLRAPVSVEESTGTFVLTLLLLLMLLAVTFTVATAVL